MERTEALEVAPGLLELHAAADDLGDVHPVAQLLQLVVAYPRHLGRRRFILWRRARP